MSTPYEKTARNKICERVGYQLQEFGIGACIPDHKKIGAWIYEGLVQKLKYEPDVVVPHEI